MLEKRKKTYRDPDRLPPVSVLLVNAPDDNGDLTARSRWNGRAKGEEPAGASGAPQPPTPHLAPGTASLRRLTLIGHGPRLRLGGPADPARSGTNPKRILGIYRAGLGGRPDRADRQGQRIKEWMVPAGGIPWREGRRADRGRNRPVPRRAWACPRRARVVARLGDPTAPRAVSLIAIHQHGIPDDFPDDVIEEADRARSPWD